MARRTRHVIVHDGLPIMAAGVVAMADAMNRGGFDTSVWNLHAERNASIVSNLKRDLSPVRLLAISVHWFYQLPYALDLAREARAVGFDGFIALGGFTASLWARDLLRRHGEIDGVVRGDGEEPILELAHQLSLSRRSLKKVKNLVWRSRSGIVTNGFDYTGAEPQIDELQFGRLDLIRNLPTHLAQSSWRAITDGSRTIDIDLSATFYLCGGRGCSVSCATCGGGREAHRTHSRRRRVAFRSPSRIADDVQQAMGHGATSIHACFDPVPNGPHWHAFMGEMQRRRIGPPMIFECFGLPDSGFLDHFAATFDAGIIVISPETASEKVRAKIRGFAFTNRQLEHALEGIARRGLAAQVFLGYFAPLEGLAGLYRSRSWARKLADEYGDHIEVMHYPYSTDPGSPLARHPAQFGMRCSLSRPVDWEEGLDDVEPWLGNLMRHEPDVGDPQRWKSIGLGVEMEQACLRDHPRLHALIDRELGGRVDRFFGQLASRVLRTHDPDTLERGSLSRILVEAIEAGRVVGSR